MYWVSLKKIHPEFFRDNVEFGSFFGCFPFSLWNGGRLIMHDQCDGNFITNVVKSINAEGIPVRYTFTNPVLTEEDLEDPFCNFCMKAADNGMNEVMVFSPILEQYIRDKYPSYKINSSTCKEIKNVDDINKELEKNIRELDRPVFDLVNRHVATSSNRMNALSGIVSTSQLEGVTKSQQILVSEMKHNAQIAIGQATDFLTHIGEQRVLTEQILISLPDDNGNKTCQIPVIISETVSDAQQNVRTEICVPEGLSGESATRIMGVIRSKDDLNWGKNEKSPLVDDEFARLLDESNASSRVKELIRKLYDKNDYETL